MNEETIKHYVIALIESTFGFKPQVEIKFPTDTMVHIYLDGSPAQRQQMMGKDSHTFQCLKFFLRVYARRHDFYSYLYIKPYATDKRQEQGYN